MAKDLARVAAVSDRTVQRFLVNQVQTPKIAGRLARALGRAPARYLIRSEEAAAVAR